MTQVKLDKQSAKLSLVHVLVAFIAFGIAALFGLLQGLDRATIITLPSWLNYYQVLTGHGALMGLVFTTFFIVGFLFAGIARVNEGSLTPAARKFGWVGFWVMLIGTLMVVVAVLTNQASVLYTFYAPMKASPLFYFGATLLIVGSWVGGWGMFANYITWRKSHKGKFSPLFMFTAICTMGLWQLCTLGVAAEVLVQLIPWSLGMVDTVNVVLSRTLFWFFGHPLVYFWLMPAYMAWYLIMPKIIGGKVFSDAITRMVFIIFFILSTPLGFHHQLLEPGIDPKWKFLHVALTMAIALPSLVTAFTMFATFELAGREKGGTGLLGWFKKLPWKDARFFSLFLAMAWFIPAGAGGIINASNQMNQVVHNTVFVTGHFHITIGTAVALTFFCVSYWLVPHLTGRKMTRMTNELGRLQGVLWSIGMLFMAGGMHVLGLLGGPRRTAGTTYFENVTALSWIPWHKLIAVGGAFLFFAAILQVGIVLYLTFWAPKGEQEFPMGEVSELAEETPRILERWPIWISVATVLILVAYGYPIVDLILNSPPGAPGGRTW